MIVQECVRLVCIGIRINMDWNEHYGTKTGWFGSQANIVWDLEDMVQECDGIENRQYCIVNIQYGSETVWYGIRTYSIGMTLDSVEVKVEIKYLKMFLTSQWLYN